MSVSLIIRLFILRFLHQPTFKVMGIHMKTVLNHTDNVNEIILLSLQMNPAVSISGISSEFFKHTHSHTHTYSHTLTNYTIFPNTLARLIRVHFGIGANAVFHSGEKVFAEREIFFPFGILQTVWKALPSHPFV